MRNPLFVLALIAAAGILGCQENAVDPLAESTDSNMETLAGVADPIIPMSAVQTCGEPAADNTSETSRERTILIDAMLAGPIKQSLIHITGQIGYTMQEIPLDCAFKRFIVGLSVAAQLTPVPSQGRVWSVAGQSNDDLYVEVVRFIDKTYALQGRNNGMMLHMRLGVTQTRVYVDSLWLESSLEQ